MPVVYYKDSNGKFAVLNSPTATVPGNAIASYANAAAFLTANATDFPEQPNYLGFVTDLFNISGFDDAVTDHNQAVRLQSLFVELRVEGLAKTPPRSAVISSLITQWNTGSTTDFRDLSTEIQTAIDDNNIPLEISSVNGRLSEP